MGNSTSSRKRKTNGGVANFTPQRRPHHYQDDPREYSQQWQASNVWNSGYRGTRSRFVHEVSPGRRSFDHQGLCTEWHPATQRSITRSMPFMASGANSDLAYWQPVTLHATRPNGTEFRQNSFFNRAHILSNYASLPTNIENSTRRRLHRSVSNLRSCEVCGTEHHCSDASHMYPRMTSGHHMHQSQHDDMNNSEVLSLWSVDDSDKEAQVDASPQTIRTYNEPYCDIRIQPQQSSDHAIYASRFEAETAVKRVYQDIPAIQDRHSSLGQEPRRRPPSYTSEETHSIHNFHNPHYDQDNLMYRPKYVKHSSKPKTKSKNCKRCAYYENRGSTIRSGCGSTFSICQMNIVESGGCIQSIGPSSCSHSTELSSFHPTSDSGHHSTCTRL